MAIPPKQSRLRNRDQQGGLFDDKKVQLNFGHRGRGAVYLSEISYMPQSNVITYKLGGREVFENRWEATEATICSVEGVADVNATMHMIVLKDGITPPQVIGNLISALIEAHVLPAGIAKTVCDEHQIELTPEANSIAVATANRTAVSRARRHANQEKGPAL